MAQINPFSSLVMLILASIASSLLSGYETIIVLLLVVIVPFFFNVNILKIMLIITDSVNGTEFLNMKKE